MIAEDVILDLASIVAAIPMMRAVPVTHVAFDVAAMSASSVGLGARKIILPGTKTAATLLSGNVAATEKLALSLVESGGEVVKGGMMRKNFDPWIMTIASIVVITGRETKNLHNQFTSITGKMQVLSTEYDSSFLW